MTFEWDKRIQDGVSHDPYNGAFCSQTAWLRRSGHIGFARDNRFSIFIHALQIYKERLERICSIPARVF